MSGAHARCSASAAHRWMLCPASIKRSDGIVQTESPYASLGTMAHSIAAYCLKNGLDANAILDDHAEAVQFYLDFCRNVCKVKPTMVEVDLTPALQTVDPDMGGTADFIMYDAKRRQLLVADLKFGTGVTVAAGENPQLKQYALGALLTTGAPAKTVRSVIVQPRLEDPDERISSHVFPALDLLDFAADCAAAAKATREKDPVPVPGAEQCKWCPAAKGNCDVAIKTKRTKPAGARATVDDFAVIDGTASKS